MPDMDIDYSKAASTTMYALEVNMFRWGKLSRKDKLDLINMTAKEISPVAVQYVDRTDGIHKETCAGSPPDNPRVPCKCGGLP